MARRRSNFATGLTRALLLGSLLFLIATGCGKKPVPLVSVEGTVQVKGKPGSNVLLTFWPQESKMGTRVTAYCDAKGQFRLECPAGLYKVTVLGKLPEISSPGLDREPASTTPKDPAKATVYVPDKYGNTSLTPLTVEVPEGGKKDLVVTVDSE